MDIILVEKDAFVDNFGRQRIFHGVNMVFKGTDRPGADRKSYVPDWSEADFKQLADDGFNAIRLGLIWDALEPEPGVYSEDYLDWIRQMLDLCQDAGLYVMLDMHQDLYSASYSDGAPEWATLSDKTFQPAEVWSHAYLFSAAVQESLDAFWGNAKAEDGASLQEHYSAMWSELARQFAHHPALLGYDFFNEPVPGSISSIIFEELMTRLATMVSERDGKQITVKEAAAMLDHPEKAGSLFKELDNKEQYHQFVSAAQECVTSFDRQVLNPFYNRITHAIRSMSNRGIIFRENSYFSNMGAACMADPVRWRGQHEPLQAFAPHGYDLVTDTDHLSQASNTRIDYIFDQHRQTQQRLQVPVIVGEWGAFYNHDGRIKEHGRYITRLFERYQWSDLYWSYQDNWQNTPARDLLRRPYAKATAGRITSQETDWQNCHFKMTWQGDPSCSAPTVIYLPEQIKSVSLIKGSPSSMLPSDHWTWQDQHLFIPVSAKQHRLEVTF